MKKLTKIILASTGAITALGTLIGFSTSFNSINVVSIGGSASVLPLVTELSNIFTKADIVTQSGGSGAGIRAAIDGSRNIGMASRTPGVSLNDEDLSRRIANIDLQLANSSLSLEERNSLDRQKISITRDAAAWREKNIKTVTIAWDGIAILYRPANMGSKEELVLTAENVAKIFAAFSGVIPLKLSDLDGLSDNNLIIPYPRAGGANVSGTAEAFERSSNRNWEDTNFFKSLGKTDQNLIKNALETGAYVGNNVRQTAEANSQAWSIARNGKIGSMIYLSAGFVNNNIEEIEKAGFKVASYDPGVLPTAETVSKTYGWFRPFNLMLPIGSSIPQLDFISWILDLNNTPGVNDTPQEKIIKEQGFIILSRSQILSMSQGIDEQERINQFWKASDAILQRSGANPEA
ncbi:PstS family phosphate ABC transporter substrate-binding protein [[Mycoplasma] mobile]|uniref:Phosphate binding protein n=1 Tax=Mycoplasma mobile (strain ATCC 43663 / 163K / NCTC 11711) TaxID=267748 RepID=Q6KIT0_MYCM1|nr:substrate-binding domain-containing protein [[Mycoplasma] mobile]AAT27494.1 phosphate binding protein [Mycoplasma mobile 163K]